MISEKFSICPFLVALSLNDSFLNTWADQYLDKDSRETLVEVFFSEDFSSPWLSVSRLLHTFASLSYELSHLISERLMNSVWVHTIILRTGDSLGSEMAQSQDFSYLFSLSSKLLLCTTGRTEERFLRQWNQLFLWLHSVIL